MANHETTMRKEKLLAFFNRLGGLYNLSFTGKEILRNKIIGLDYLRKKLLVVEENSDKYKSTVIDLYKVKSCRTRKIYNPINAGDLIKKKVEDFLHKIELSFHFKNENDPFTVQFYSSIANNTHEQKKLEYRTKYWERMLSKMINVQQPLVA